MGNIYKILDNLMDAFGVTQKELASSTNIPLSTINRLKAGYSDDPRLSTIKPLAAFFNVSLGQLIGDEPLPPNLQNIISSRNYTKVPLLPLKDTTSWKKTTIEKKPNNWADWVFTDERVSEYGFSIKLTSDSYTNIFPASSKLIIEPCLYHPSDGNIVLIKTPENSVPTLYKYGIDGGNVILCPVHIYNQSVKQYNAQHDVFCGIVIGCQSSYYTDAKFFLKTDEG